jgi:uncharacterized protein YodC (DUF2158 family)
MFHRDSFTPSQLRVVKRARSSTFLPLGTFVRLASGGPIGIITELDTQDRASVHWFTGDKSLLPDICLVQCLQDT